MTDVRIERFSGEKAVFIEDELRLVYPEAFAEPPYNKSDGDLTKSFRRFRAQIRKAGFRAVLASSIDGDPVGMAYGHPLPGRDRLRTTGHCEG